jgi:HD-GYP domain-containing protein (c-di-GMP phosphodiesterase class II)
MRFAGETRRSAGRECEKKLRHIRVAYFDSSVVHSDVKSRFTANHTERIAYLSKLLAEKAHLGEERMMEVFFSAKIHDLGKMATPIYILEKPGKLTNEEQYIMQRHVFDSYLIVGGREALERYRLLWWGVDHHERLDGSFSSCPFTESPEIIPIKF